MIARVMTLVLAIVASGNAAAYGQASATASSAARFVDPVAGLSLSQAIDRAMAQEPSIVAARTEIDVARGERRQAGLRPNPTVTFEQRTEPRGTDALTMVSMEWPLDLFRRRGREAVADAQVSAASLAVADRERRLAGEVRTRYGDVLMAIRDLDVLDRAIEIATRQLTLLTARVDEGRAPPLDRDLLHVEVQRLDAERRLQIGMVEAALVELRRLLGMAAGASIAVRDRLETVVDAEVEGDARAATPQDVATQRPDVREAEARVAMADAAIDRAARNGRFDMSVYGTYMRMDAGFPQMGVAVNGDLERVRGQFHYLAGGVRVDVPLANRNQGAVAAARAQRIGAQASLDAARLAAAADVAAARARETQASAAVRIYREGLQALAQRNVSIVQQSYDLGRLTLLDVLAEQRRYLDVERGYSAALRAAYEARAALVVATGGVR